MSADTLRIALLKPRSKDPLLPPEIIQITLDGIIAPRCQRYQGGGGGGDDGKNIFYAVWRENRGLNNNRGNRYWGDIYYQENKHQTKSLTAELVAAGYAELKGSRTDLSEK